MNAFQSFPLLQIIAQSDMKSDRSTVDGHLADHNYHASIDAIMGAWMTPAQLVDMVNGTNGAKKVVKIVRHAKWIASDGLARNARGGSILDSAVGMVSVIVALTGQARISFHDAHALGGGTQEGANHIAGVSRARLHRVAPALIKRAAGTLSAQYARTVGARGIFSQLGITAKADEHGFTVVNRNHPLIVMTADTLNRTSESTLIEILG